MLRSQRQDLAGMARQRRRPSVLQAGFARPLPSYGPRSVRKRPYAFSHLGFGAMSSSEVPDAILEDARISAAALGVLTYLWTRSRHARISQGEVRARFRFGRERVSARFAELQSLGYLRRVRPRDPTNQFFLGDFYVLRNPPLNERAPDGDGGAP